MEMSRVPDLDSLRLLLEIDETGSLGRAGVVHGISQPAVSARVRSMEAVVGFPLVERGARGSTLTPAGVLVAGWARDVLTAAGTLAVGAASLRGHRESQLRVAASMTVAEHLLPGWLVRLAAQNPDASTGLVAMNSAQVAETVLGGRADLGFVEGPGIPPGLDATTIGHDHLAVVVPPTHPWARPGRTVDAAELAATRLVAREPTSGTRTTAEAALAPHATPAAPLLELSTSGAVLAAVAAGAGPAILSELAIGDNVAAHRVVRVSTRGVDFRRPLRAVWPHGQRPSRLGRDLLTIARRTRWGSGPTPSLGPQPDG
jgi:DNA-binding transcriptional LysR family regulator